MNNPVGSDVKTTFFTRGKIVCFAYFKHMIHSDQCVHTHSDKNILHNPSSFLKGREIKSIECVRLCIGMIGKYLCIE